MATKKAKPEQLTVEQLNDRLSEWGWRLHATAQRWYPPLEDGSPHLPLEDGKPAVETLKFLHMTDLTAAIETEETHVLVRVIEKWGIKP